MTHFALRPRLRLIDRLLRGLLLLVLFGFLARWIPGGWVRDHWWNLPGTAPYHGQQPGPGVGEG